MSEKKARAARQADPARFEAKRASNEIRDLRAARAIEAREALEVEKAEIKRERLARQTVRRGLFRALVGRWTA